MAGDWIKMRVDLMDDPSVVAIAVRLDMDEDHVVGKLHRLWSWADRHTIDGATSGVNEAWVDRFVAKKGFAAAMADVGWLSISADGIRFPGFEKHNGESAKKRADAQQRQRESRQSRHTSVTKPSRDIVPSPFRRTVLNRDQYTCVYCGTESSELREKEGKKARMSIDHIMPVSRGGKTVIENLATCCRACNYEKSDRTPEEWDLLPTFLADGVFYENGHIVVTKQRDKNVTREEKRRDIHTASAVCVGDTPQPPSEQPVVDTPAKSQPPPKPRAFAPPTVDEVRAYVAELKANVDADRFVDFYASKGWMVGKNQMRDWKAAVRTWARSEDGSTQTAIRASAGGTSAGPAGGSREQQRENANNAAIAGFLQRRGVRAGDGGADRAEANRSVHGEGTGRLALRLEAVPGPDPERGGGGTGNVGNAVPRGGGPVPPVSAEDAAGVLPKPGR